MLPIDAFAAFARNQCDADDVFRVIVQYPLYWAARPGFGAPLGEVWAYTDPAAVQRAQAGGAPPGPLQNNVHGFALFGDRPAGTAFIRINPLSPPELSWNVPAEAFEVAETWVRAVQIEMEIARRALAGMVPFAALAIHQHFIVHRAATGAFLTLPGRAPFQNPAVICTGPDCGRRVVAQLPPQMQVGLTAGYASGAELLQALPAQGVDGVIFNPAGPGPTVPAGW